MDGQELIRTTGSVRQFTDEPVDDETLYAILDDARFAPSGGNRQPWRVVVVKDLAQRRSLGALMTPVWDEYVAIAATGVTPFSSSMTPGSYEPRFGKERRHVPNDTLDKIEDLPVVLVVAVDLALVAMMDKELSRPPVAGGGSIYPFCWNVLLAARDRGLGGVLTTFLSRVEPEAAAGLVLPPDYALAATLFLGHPVKQHTKLKRRAVKEFTTVDRFDGPVFG